MAFYNVSKIENWYDDFNSCQRKFVNDSYDDYKNSYIKKCNDNIINKMESTLNYHYEKIKRVYSNIDKYWKEYLNDIKNTDNRLAGKTGGINASIVFSKLKSLPVLKEYEAGLSVKLDNVSAIIGTPKHTQWIEDNVTWETCAVITTSVISGIVGLAESCFDGVMWAGSIFSSSIVSIFDEGFAESIQKEAMDAIAYDFTGEMNKKFYEETKIGRRINDVSAIKYDGEVAQTIQNVSTKVTEFALATALTIATGGCAAPVTFAVVFGTGFMIGAGQKAEENFQQEDRDFWGDCGEITVAGGIKAVEFYFEGQMGAGMINAANVIKSSGGVTNFFKNMRIVLSNGKSSLFTKESLKNGFKATLKDADTYIDSIGAAFNNITYDSENGLQVNWESLAKETACNFALNSAFGFVGNAFQTKMADGIKNIEPIKTPPAKSINQINFEDEVVRINRELVDNYNYLYSLKENGTLEELIRQGQEFDVYTGVKLTNVDATLEKYAKRIDDLQNLVFKDDVVMTSRQRNLYDAMNDSIKKLNEQFGAEYGPDIGIRQVTAYSNGQVDLSYIPSEYRDIIKDYSYDELQEYLLLKKNIEICNDFSKNGKMTNNYTNNFSKYVDADKISETKYVNILLTDEVFKMLSQQENWMAFNNGSNSYMNLKYPEVIIKANMSHENIHQMASNNGISGIYIDESHRGINETFTEYLNKFTLKSDYPKQRYCGYQDMVDRLDFLVQKGIFTNDDIMSAYFNNDITTIKNKVNQLAGSNNYYDNFVTAFQNAHDNNLYNDLDRCCMDLDYWNSRKISQRDFVDTLDLTEITQEIPIH